MINPKAGWQYEFLGLARDLLLSRLMAGGGDCPQARGYDRVAWQVMEVDCWCEMRMLLAEARAALGGAQTCAV